MDREDTTQPGDAPTGGAETSAGGSGGDPNVSPSSATQGARVWWAAGSQSPDAIVGSEAGLVRPTAKAPSLILSRHHNRVLEDSLDAGLIVERLKADKRPDQRRFGAQLEAQIDAVNLLRGAYYDASPVWSHGRKFIRKGGYQLIASVPWVIMAALVARYGAEELFEPKKGGLSIFDEWLAKSPWRISNA